MADSKQTLGITVLGSGSKGNATLIHNDSEALLIDVGFSAVEIGRRLRAAGLTDAPIKGIVVSHEHSDHVRGLRVFAKKLGVPVFANRATADALRDQDSKHGPMIIFAPGNPFHVGSFAVVPFSIPHDAYDPVAFVVTHGSRRIGVATDLGHPSSLVTYQLRECDALIIESNHDVEMLSNSQRPWNLKQRILGRHGHLSNEACAQLLRAILHERTRHVILAHASQECNRYELAERIGTHALTSLQRADVRLHVARQDQVSPTLWL